MKKFLFLSGLLLLLSLGKTVYADDCTIIYGGGEIKCQATISADQNNIIAVPTQQPGNPATTKGGLPVYQPTNATQTPGTGPEAFGLLSLIPAAAAGLYLRKKTK